MLQCDKVSRFVELNVTFNFGESNRPSRYLPVFIYCQIMIRFWDCVCSDWHLVVLLKFINILSFESCFYIVYIPMSGIAMKCSVSIHGILQPGFTFSWRGAIRSFLELFPDCEGYLCPLWINVIIAELSRKNISTFVAFFFWIFIQRVYVRHVPVIVWRRVYLHLTYFT